jgi:hypothetical protein
MARAGAPRYTSGVAGSPFRASFSRWASRVRARLALGHVLTGAACGLALGAVAAGACFWLRVSAARPAGALLGVVGAAAGYAIARRRRWADGDVALYLDARLGSNEAIATAVELDARRDDDDDSPAHVVVLAHATDALGAATAKRVRPRVLSLGHAALPVAAAIIGYLSVRALPPAPAAAAPPPGTERVKLADVRGLDKIEDLERLDARDPAQRERLKRLADDAKKLRERLKDGMEKREAQAEIARIKDGILAERLSLGAGEQRQGLESATSKLGENPVLKKADKALGDRDLVSFDEEMERLANQLEKQDREKAEKTLEDAAQAAEKNGAKDVAKELARQKELMQQRGEKADKLRELAKDIGDGLGEEGKQALEDWKQSGSAKDQQKLEKALEGALEKMSPEERKRLADKIKKNIAKAEEGGAPGGPSKEQLKDLAEQLDTPEGRKQLEDELKRMAEDDESKRQEKLDDAEDGAGEAEGQLGGTPIPFPVSGDGKPGKDKSSGGKDDAGKASPGHSDDEPGKADHHGMTGKIEGGDLKSRAGARINKARPMPGTVTGRSAGQAGETANTMGDGAIGRAAPGEVSGVDRSDVPEEYREQVGRYFEPK